MTDSTATDNVTPHTRGGRRLAIFALIAIFFAAVIQPGISQAWTNNSRAYNLVQTPSWGNVIDTDGSGNSYVAISVVDTFTIGSVTASVGSSFRYLILKTDRSGSAVWGTALDLDGWGDVLALKADAAGNVYLAGKYSGTATIGATTLTSNGGSDIFVAKLNTSGAVAWVHSFGGTSNDWGNGVGVDGSGNLYVSGVIQGTVSFGSTNLTSAGSNDIFLTKLNSSGVAQWATKVGGTGDDNGGWMQGLAVDSAGNSFVSGGIQGTVTVAGNALTSAGGLDVFVGKVNTSGVWQWGVIGGSSGNENTYGVSLDGQGGAFLTGVYRAAASFGASSLAYSGGDDSYIARVNSSGAWQWARAIQGTSGEYVSSIDVDSSGAPIVSGYFYSTSLAIGGSTISYAGGNGADGWASKWNASGTFQWAAHLGGTDDDGFYGVAVDSDDNVRVTGWAGKSNSVSFNGGTPISIMPGCTNSCWSYVEWTLSPTGAVPSATTSTTSTTTSTTSTTTTTSSTVAPSVTTVAPSTNNPVTAPASGTSGSTKSKPTASTTTLAPTTTGVIAVPTTTTTIPRNLPDAMPVKLGDLAAHVNGKVVATTVRRESNTIVASAAGLTARYGAIDGSNNPVPLDNDGNLRVLPGQTISFELDGADPESTGEAWMFSEPTKLGAFEVDANGSAIGSFTIPESSQTGDHTLLVATRNAAGEQTELRLGIAVGEMNSGADVTVWLIVLPIILAVAGALILPATRRRRTRNSNPT